MIEDHYIQPPAWMKSLVDEVVVGAIRPLGFIGNLGYRAWDPESSDNTFAGWQLAIFPAPYEIRGASREDGHRKCGGFSLDLGKILGTFSKTDTVEWFSPTCYAGDLDGPEIRVVGVFAGQRVALRIFSVPPYDEPATHYVDPVQGEATAIE